jgi:hypothetical protein
MRCNGGAEQLVDDLRCEPPPLEYEPTVRASPIDVLTQQLLLVVPQDLREFFGVEVGFWRGVLFRG